MLHTGKVWGPYIRNSDGRAIVMVEQDGCKRVKLYARYELEERLGRYLASGETVDHIDGNPLNDSLSNLQVLSLAANVRKSAVPAEVCERECPVCKVRFTHRLRDYRHNQIKQGKAGPYCSKSCAGKVHN